MTTSTTPSYIMNALAIDFESIYSLEDPFIYEIFKKIESSGLKSFLRSSLDIYVPELRCFYGRGVVSDERKIVMPLGKQYLLIDQ